MLRGNPRSTLPGCVSSVLCSQVVHHTTCLSGDDAGVLAQPPRRVRDQSAPVLLAGRPNRTGRSDGPRRKRAAATPCGGMAPTPLWFLQRGGHHLRGGQRTFMSLGSI